MARVYRFREVVSVGAPVAEVFAYLRQPNHLVDIMPAHMHLRIDWPKDRLLSLGDTFTTHLRKGGLPLRWDTRVTAFALNEYFTDVQLQGPFRRWDHTHYVRVIPGGTEVVDEIEIEMPLGPLGELAMWLFVQRDLMQTFAHRKARFTAAFPPVG